MCTKNNKQKNSTESEQKEAVGLMGWLGALLNNKQTQEELNQRTLFYQVGTSKYLPDPNKQSYLKNQGAYWTKKRGNKIHNDEV